MEVILYKEESFKIIGICMEVHRELGPGFVEAVYKDALEIEFKLHDIPYKREKSFAISYKGTLLKRHFIADFVVFESIILEIKSSEFIVTRFIAQTINYLKTSSIKLGILINFGESSLVYKRVVF